MNVHAIYQVCNTTSTLQEKKLNPSISEHLLKCFFVLEIFITWTTAKSL